MNASAKADEVRIDHLHRTQSTLDFLFDASRFRVGGLPQAVHRDLRKAIDASIAVHKQWADKGENS